MTSLIQKFDIQDQELWPCYVECFDQLLLVNNLMDTVKQRSLFLSMLGASTWHSIYSLMLLSKLLVCTYNEDVKPAQDGPYCSQASMLMSFPPTWLTTSRKHYGLHRWNLSAQRILQSCRPRQHVQRPLSLWQKGPGNTSAERPFFRVKPPTSISNVSVMPSLDEPVNFTRSVKTDNLTKGGQAASNCTSRRDSHDWDSCRFWYAKCNSCKKKGHIEQAYFVKQPLVKKKEAGTKTLQTHTVQDRT